MKQLKLVLAVISALLLSGAVVGLAVLLNPPRHPPPEQFTEAATPIGPDMGLYIGEDGNSYQALPGIDGGMMRYPVSRWGAPAQGADLAAIIAGYRRSAEQPYTVQEIEVHRGETLRGWLLMPENPKGGAVLLHGSGVSDRRNSYYVCLAHMLAEEGYAVILPDKRGSGQSGGDWRNEALSELAADGAAWLEVLRLHLPDVPYAGFIGVSQGGIIAPEAARLADADFAASLSASAVSLRAALRHEVGNDVRAGGAPGLLQGPLAALFSLRAERRHPGFWKLNGSYTMLGQWEAWQGPLFVAYGAEDETDNVPVAESVRQLSAVVSGGNPVVKVYAGTGHSLMDANGVFMPAFREDLLNWLAARRPSDRWDSGKD